MVSGRWVGGMLAALALTMGGLAFANDRLQSRGPEVGFACLQPEQAVVERVLRIDVDESRSVGGAGDDVVTSSWSVQGREVVTLTCTGVTERERDRRAPVPGETGHVDGDPPFLLLAPTAPDVAATIRFVLLDAIVEMEVHEPVDVHGARDLVTSVVASNEEFGGRTPDLGG